MSKLYAVKRVSVDEEGKSRTEVVAKVIAMTNVNWWVKEQGYQWIRDLKDPFGGHGLAPATGATFHGA